MEFYRVFVWNGEERGAGFGGPLYVPRDKQGAGRHDIPERDGVLYGSQVAVSALAEAIKPFRGRIITDQIFMRPEGLRVAMARLELDDDIELLDLDNPQTLMKFDIHPSQVVSLNRQTTQEIARKLFDLNVAGFAWWSTLNSSWKNATLFENRIKKHIRLIGDVIELNVKRPDVRQAAKNLHIKIR